MTTLRDKIFDIIHEQSKGFDEFTRDKKGLLDYTFQVTEQIIEEIKNVLAKELS